MGSFIANTDEQQQEMLSAAGYDSYDDLFAHIPEAVRLGRDLSIRRGLSEMEVIREMENLAEKNTVFKHIFRGAGSYDHFIPSIVKEVVAKEEFVTAYTPYQAEVSQGNLQTIFEYQTLMCELTGMDVSNASVYDGATAAAESVFMCRDRKRKSVVISGTVAPAVIDVIRTYCSGRETEITVVPAKDGLTDKEAVSAVLDSGTACLIVQQPNFFGNIEDADELCEAAHAAGAKFVMSVDPIAMAVLKTPGECGADIAVGEGQALGMPMGFGGPYLGFMTAAQKMMRQLPGRIVGQTEDSEGNVCYVLTLQAREQHIRREKASSNICSNEALCALTATVYLSALGPDGLKQAAGLSADKAHYLQQELAKAGFAPAYPQAEFFKEFVTECPVPADRLMAELEKHSILGGLPLADGKILWCATEKNTKEDIDELVRLAKEVIC
ncbi:MAG: aminomethyl-transferring glycine dehydrogenase subunit GcvPA [Eubacteriaceae bacterium]|jgi:glycine dehydrogenase subunit 1|nr:aminomethyl-transferring glycine dehydrogenase subunit GcvPA [Eubacteriaceae bacterium]